MVARAQHGADVANGTRTASSPRSARDRHLLPQLSGSRLPRQNALSAALAEGAGRAEASPCSSAERGARHSSRAGQQGDPHQLAQAVLFHRLGRSAPLVREPGESGECAQPMAPPSHLDTSYRGHAVCQHLATERERARPALATSAHSREHVNLTAATPGTPHRGDPVLRPLATSYLSPLGEYIPIVRSHHHDPGCCVAGRASRRPRDRTVGQKPRFEDAGACQIRPRAAGHDCGQIDGVRPRRSPGGRRGFWPPGRSLGGL